MSLLFRKWDKIEAEKSLAIHQQMAAGRWQAWATTSYFTLLTPSISYQTEDVREMTGQANILGCWKGSMATAWPKGLYRGCGITVGRAHRALHSYSRFMRRSERHLDNWGLHIKRACPNGIFMDWSTWILTNRRWDGYQF